MAIPAPYNLTLTSNATSYLNFVKLVNDNILGGWYGTLIMIAFFSITFLVFFFSTKNGSQSFMASSFVSFLVALLLWAAGLLPPLIIMLSLILVAFSVAFSKLKD